MKNKNIILILLLSVLSCTEVNAMDSKQKLMPICSGGKCTPLTEDDHRKGSFGLINSSIGLLIPCIDELFFLTQELDANYRFFNFCIPQSFAHIHGSFIKHNMERIIQLYTTLSEHPKSSYNHVNKSPLLHKKQKEFLNNKIKRIENLIPKDIKTKCAKIQNGIEQKLKSQKKQELPSSEKSTILVTLKKLFDLNSTHHGYKTNELYIFMVALTEEIIQWEHIIKHSAPHKWDYVSKRKNKFQLKWDKEFNKERLERISAYYKIRQILYKLIDVNNTNKTLPETDYSSNKKTPEEKFKQELRDAVSDHLDRLEDNYDNDLEKHSKKV